MRKLLLFLTLPLFLLDFATKQYIVSNFAEPQDLRDPGFSFVEPDTVTVIEGFFDIVRVHNTGVAFGMANRAESANLIFGGVSLAALLLIWRLYRSQAFSTRTSRVAVALLVAGILGNLLDRCVRGYVVDFLHFYYRGYSWPSFNVADSCICIAAGLLVFSAFQKAPAAKPGAQAA
jgi:signal peptidase II